MGSNSGKGQAEINSCPLAEPRVDGDSAAVRVHDALNGREPNTSTRRGGARRPIERLEDVPNGFARNSRAAILDGDIAPFVLDGVHADPHLSFRRAIGELHGVTNDVSDDDSA